MIFNCKRCNQEYAILGGHCKNCDMFHYYSGKERCSIKLGIYKIIWDYNESYVTIFTYKLDENTVISMVKLPLLPYDITLDKLKTYLLFI